jgi:hypothetical protein
VNGTVPQLGKQLNADILGSNNQPGFGEWVAAILTVSIVAKSLDLPDAGRALMVLVVLVYLLADKGLITQIEQQFATIKNPVTGSAAATIGPAPPAGSVAAGAPTQSIVAAMGTIPGAQNAIQQAVEANSPTLGDSGLLGDNLSNAQ